MTYLDDMIYRIYDQLEIKPGQIYMRMICAKLNIKLIVDKIDSRNAKINGQDYIFLNETTKEYERLYDFAHELGHFFLHTGNQFKSNTVYVDYQERQANNFADRFLVPLHEIDKLEMPADRAAATYLVETKFNVTTELAKKRLTYYERLLYERKINNYMW